MGAYTFQVHANGRTAHEAFDAARDQALYERGHGGYTGTIAEKDSFVMISLPACVDPEVHAQHLIDTSDPRIDDKWGPAGCIDCGLVDDRDPHLRRFLFFGWASS